jgi:hypothetical protein
VPAAGEIHADVGILQQHPLNVLIVQSGADCVQRLGGAGQVLVGDDWHPLADRGVHGIHDMPLPAKAACGRQASVTGRPGHAPM